jgi:hypothetical protein
MNTRGVFGTTQAALNEAAHEWRTRLVGGVCYEPVPVAGSSPLANARSAISLMKWKPRSTNYMDARSHWDAFTRQRRPIV